MFSVDIDMTVLAIFYNWQQKVSEWGHRWSAQRRVLTVLRDLYEGEMEGVAAFLDQLDYFFVGGYTYVFTVYLEGFFINIMYNDVYCI